MGSPSQDVVGNASTSCVYASWSGAYAQRRHIALKQQVMKVRHRSVPTAHRTRPRRGWRLHHRAKVRSSRSLRLLRCGAHIFWLHAWRSRRHRRDGTGGYSLGGHCLPDRRGFPHGYQPSSGDGGIGTPKRWCGHCGDARRIERREVRRRRPILGVAQRRATDDRPLKEHRFWFEPPAQPP